MLAKRLIVLTLVGGAMTLLNASDMKKSEEVYMSICASCHGTMGEGNPKVPDAPALNTHSEDDLKLKLSEIKGSGFDSYHEKMSKNQKIIELRGMGYDSEEMAEFIYNSFNEDAR